MALSFALFPLVNMCACTRTHMHTLYQYISFICIKRFDEPFENKLKVKDLYDLKRKQSI